MKIKMNFFEKKMKIFFFKKHEKKNTDHFRSECFLILSKNISIEQNARKKRNPQCQGSRFSCPFGFPVCERVMLHLDFDKILNLSTLFGFLSF